MKIFISWSGTRSEAIAKALRGWLPNLLQAVVPFTSNQDIKKGERGLVTISAELEQSNVGIICLTPENLEKPWILFEAGALSKSSAAHVCTFLYDVASTNIEAPLGEFQYTKNERDDIKHLCSTINDLLGDRKLDPSRFEQAFDVWYPKLEEKLKAIPAPQEDEKRVDQRSPEDKLDEVLRAVRNLSKAAQPVAAAGFGPASYPPPYVPGRRRGPRGEATTLNELTAELTEGSDSAKDDIAGFMRYLLIGNKGAVEFETVKNNVGFLLAERAGLVTMSIRGGIPFVIPTEEGLVGMW